MTTEIARLRLKLISATAENERLRETISFQLGGLILRARTLRGLMELPAGLMRLRHESLRLRGRKASDGHAERMRDQRIQHLFGLAPELEVEDLVSRMLKESQDNDLAARLIADLAQVFQPIDYDKSVRLARRVVEIEPSGRNLQWLGAFLYDNGEIEEPRRLFARARKAGAVIPANVRRRIDVLEGLARVRDRGLPLKPHVAGGTASRRSQARTLMYVAASSFPHHVTGYTARTHALIKAIAGAGWRVEAVTRPGYPHDRNDAVNVGSRLAAHDIEGVVYNRLPGGPSHGMPFDRYAAQASRALLGHIHQKRPSVVHAASNYINAAPALMAAREAGLPFVYEVRGLWELTHAARTPHWENSERFVQQREMETVVAREADAVVAISQGLRDELVERGVDARKITVVPNSVDAERFKPRPKDAALARELGIGDRRVLGFLGSMTSYEGLVDLVTALSELRHDGQDVCALLVGEGPAFREVREAARDLNVLDRLIMPGRVPHLETPRWYSVMDLACYPRRPARVTELVPPLKPLEAMSMELPVVASNLSAIRETVVDRKNGFLFEKGDVDGLTALLSEVLNSPAQSLKVGRAARRHVQDRYTWSRAASTLDGLYARHAG